MDNDYNAPILSEIIDVIIQETTISLNDDSQYVEFVFDNLGTETILIKIKDKLTETIKTIKLISNASIGFKQLNVSSIKVLTTSGTSKLFYCFQGYLKTIVLGEGVS